MKKGDYVIATKYSDGDPQDHWYIGMYDREAGGRHYVIDGEGNQARGNGFRQAKKISAERGAWLLKNAKQIEQSGKSVWWWIRKKMDITTASTEQPNKRQVLGTDYMEVRMTVDLAKRLAWLITDGGGQASETQMVQIIKALTEEIDRIEGAKNTEQQVQADGADKPLAG